MRDPIQPIIHLHLLFRQFYKADVAFLKDDDIVHKANDVFIGTLLSKLPAFICHEAHVHSFSIRLSSEWFEGLLALQNESDEASMLDDSQPQTAVVESSQPAAVQSNPSQEDSDIL